MSPAAEVTFLRYRAVAAAVLGPPLMVLFAASDYGVKTWVAFTLALVTGGGATEYARRQQTP